MKILSITVNDYYREIVIEKSYFFGLHKKKLIYRKSNDGTIIRYKPTDIYRNLGINEWLQVRELFNIKNL
jgi:hypothetical protein